MSKPAFIDDFPEGDDDSYAVSTRLPKGGYQFILDVMSEFGCPNKSQALRLVVQFATTWMPRIAEQTGQPFSADFTVERDFERAEQDWTRHEDKIRSLNKRLQLIARVDDATYREALLKTAQRKAAHFGIPWPPPETPLIEYDTEAFYVHKRILDIANQKETNRISLRDLLLGSLGDKEKTLPVLQRLAEDGFIELTEERRSGPPTVWITIPTFPVHATSDAPRE